MSHVGLYSPYIPKHRGGGEKYLLSLAEVAARTHKTSLLVPQSEVERMREAIPMYEKIFGLDLGNVDVIGSSLGSVRNPVLTMAETKRFSHLFAMTDGSIFPTLATHSYFVVQVPWTRSLSLPEKLKLNTWDKVLVYSDFVKDVLQHSWGSTKIDVVAPYVDTQVFVPGKKEKVILNVGRFFRHTTSNSKRQDVIIDAFKRLVDKGVLTHYSLVLAGNIDANEDSHTYLQELKQRAYGYHINFLTDLSFDRLRSHYATSQFYWHAAGFGIDPVAHPENTEHFGITTLEAMSSGCIPLVVPYGGQKEVVDDQRFFWETIDELYEKMYQLVREKKSTIDAMSQDMRKQAAVYSKERFTKTIEKLLI